jgi:hypothetical protein
MNLFVTPRDPPARRLGAGFQVGPNVRVCRLCQMSGFSPSVTPQTSPVTPQGGHPVTPSAQGFGPSVTCDPLLYK